MKCNNTYLAHESNQHTPDCFAAPLESLRSDVDTPPSANRGVLPSRGDHKGPNRGVAVISDCFGRFKLIRYPLILRSAKAPPVTSDPKRRRCDISIAPGETRGNGAIVKKTQGDGFNQRTKSFRGVMEKIVGK